jgi:chromosome segregation protein
MRLSQIKIAGFKSFVDPTKIMFPANITGIVGPNGCGKSNVIDAVRWVMGESSAKNLRGESMEDVIFSGSSGRKPVGQATVELIFDNSDGRVKGEYANYAEISVKRLSTRAGQSKYFLNNTRCRRRDIADIFLGTGLGPRSYSIIEQGMVSRIIDAKPEELRVYLEEAAGISKYKERRRETETRIRHTRENLDRLNDLIEEIEKQLARLERQAKTAGKFKLLKEEQRQVEAESLLLQKRQYDSRIEAGDRELASVENALEERIAIFRKIESQIEECRAKHIEATDQHNENQSEYYRLGSEISTHEQSIQHQKSLREHNEKELLNIERALTETEQVIGSDNSRLLVLQSDIAAITPEIEMSAADLEESEAAAVEAESQMSSWQEVWDQFRRDFHTIHESAQIENRGIEHIERQIRLSQQREERLQEELNSLDTSETENEIIKLENLIESIKLEQTSTLDQVRNQGEEIQQLRGLIAEQSSQLDEKRGQVQSLKGRLGSLETLQQNVLTENDDRVSQWLARNNIDSARRLTAMINVRGGFEKAAEVVLSTFLGAYCLDAEHSIPHQLPENRGLALMERRPVSKELSRDWPRLVDYIDCEVDLSSLLQHVYVCEDETEVADKKRQLKAGESLITADAMWCGSNWVMQVGDDDQHSGILEREKEIKSIRTKIEDITQNALALKSRIEGDRQRLESAEKQWDEDQRRVSQMQQQASDWQNQATQHKGRVDQTQSRHTQLQKELAESREQQEKFAVELSLSSNKRNELLSQIEILSAKEAELQGGKSNLQDQLTSSRARLQSSREQTHQNQIKLQSRNSELGATQSNIQRMGQQIEQFSQRRIELKDAIDKAITPVKTLQQTLQTLLDSRRSSEKTLSESQEQVTALDLNQRQLETDRNNQQQQVDEIRSRLEDSRMQYQEIRVRAKTIEEQLQGSGHDLIELQNNLDENANLTEWQTRLESLNNRIGRLGPINLAAIDEQKEQAERKDYLDAQQQDLLTALETLESAIRKIDRETRDRFKETYEHVNSRISDRFPKLFGGGEAHLELTENDLLNTGVVIMARPPGKRVTNLQLLSGGEKALTAVALIFAIFELNPSPFCMLDEVDAPLDDANVGRFCAMVEEMSEQVQFIMITHNKITMELAQNLNGVTMHEPGVSRLVSVNVGEAAELAGV